MVWGSAEPDPGDAVAAREGVGLAAIAALQELLPNQRATLVLREVLQFSAAETAEILGVGVAAVNSSLQRARASIGDGLTAEGRTVEELDETERQVWADFCAAFEAHDIDTVVELMAHQATWEMPPFDRFYRGPEAIGILVRNQCPARAEGDLVMVPCIINGRPAAGMYLRDDRGPAAFQLVALEIEDRWVRRVVGFFDPDVLARAMPARAG